MLFEVNQILCALYYRNLQQQLQTTYSSRETSDGEEAKDRGVESVIRKDDTKDGFLVGVLEDGADLN